MQYRVSASSVSGTLIAPASKSQTLRAIVFASMATGTSTIYQPLNSPDVMAMLSAIEQLGAGVRTESACVHITGVSGKPKQPDDVINAGNSGQVLRFIAALSALQPGYVVLTGDRSVRFNRPMAPLLRGLSDLGAWCVSTKDDGHAPVVIQGPLCAGRAVLPGEDSQPVSALLMASAFLEGSTQIVVTSPGETPWVQLTLSWFDRFGIPYTQSGFSDYVISGKASIPAFEYTVPGDFSSIAYAVVAAIVTRSSVRIDGLSKEDAQGDKAVVAVLQAWGADITWENESLVVAQSKPLTGGEVDVNEFIDALPILAVAACFGSGTTRLVNAAIARKKESDRLHAMTVELTKMGAIIEEQHDSLTIQPSVLHGAQVSSHSDHRIAMALAVAGLASDGTTDITDVACVQKSYPEFHAAMAALQADIVCVS